MLKKNENISYLSKCKICGNTKLKKVIKLNKQYISATFVKSNKKNDLKKIKTSLTLSLCIHDGNINNCGHFQLHEIINPDLLYRNYFYRSATSDTMRKDLKNVVENVLKISLYENKRYVIQRCLLLRFFRILYGFLMKIRATDFFRKLRFLLESES